MIFNFGVQPMKKIAILGGEELVRLLDTIVTRLKIIMNEADR
jgi:phosphotransferase system IIB component